MPGAEPGDSRGAHRFGSSDRADSAGFPWEGRRFEHDADTSDDGSADPALLAALTEFSTGSDDQVPVVEAVRGARLLVPLLAHAGELGETPDGRTVDKTQELSIATVRAPDGRAVLPAFSSVQTMSAWNPRARPVPAVGPRIALAAAGEQTELVVVDPTSPTEFVLRRAVLKALATGEPWTPPWTDEALLAEFSSACEAEESVAAVALANGDPTCRLQGPEVEVRLALKTGLDQDALAGVVRRLTSAWAASETIAERVDSMTLRLVST